MALLLDLSLTRRRERGNFSEGGVPDCPLYFGTGGGETRPFIGSCPWQRQIPLYSTADLRCGHIYQHTKTGQPGVAVPPRLGLCFRSGQIVAPRRKPFIEWLHSKIRMRAF